MNAAYDVKKSHKYEQDAIENLRRDGYSETVIEHWLKPRNIGQMASYDGYSGQTTSLCGDSMWMWLKLKDSVIQEVTFISDVCLGAVVSGSILTELSSGKGIADALQISPDDVINALGGLPENYVHCATLGCRTLKNAIINYNSFKDAPWKRLYGQK